MHVYMHGGRFGQSRWSAKLILSDQMLPLFNHMITDRSYKNPAHKKKVSDRPVESNSSFRSFLITYSEISSSMVNLFKIRKMHRKSMAKKIWEKRLLYYPPLQPPAPSSKPPLVSHISNSNLQDGFR